MSAQAVKPFTLRGWHVLAMMLGFFATVIAVNAVFITLAIGSFPGEDVRRSYLQGLNYNETLEARRTQAAIGWRASATLEDASSGARLVVVLRDHEGAPVDDAVLSGELRWPTTAKHDQALVFSHDGPGRYVAPITQLGEGDWRLRAHAESASGALDFEANLPWPASH